MSFLKTFSNIRFINWLLELHLFLNKLFDFAKAQSFHYSQRIFLWMFFWLQLFCISALISEISLRKKFCRVSYLSAKTEKLSFGQSFIFSSVDVEIFSFSLASSSVLWSKPSNSFSWSFVGVFAEFLMKSEFLSFLNNNPVVTKVLISSSKSAAGKSPHCSFFFKKFNIRSVVAFCLLFPRMW